jgi:hypothetical protein
MAGITITIETDNAAFEPSTYLREVRHVLSQALTALGNEDTPKNLRDSNGNTVGRIEVAA